MAGGTYRLKNKIQPGIYINRKTQIRPTVDQAESGVVAYIMDLDWGERDKIIILSSLDDCFTKLGYTMNDPKMRPLVEMFRGSNRTAGANSVKIFIPNVANQTKATATVGTVTATASCYGKRGNDLSFMITPDVSSEIGEDQYAVYRVQVVLDGTIVSTQTVGSYESSEVYEEAKIKDLENTEFITWSGTPNDPLTATAGTNLTGGTNQPMSEAEYSTGLTAFERVFFNVLCYDGNNATIVSAISTFIERQCENRGLYCQAVLVSDDPVNYEGIIPIKNGMNLSDGFELTKYKATWWYAGCTAGANYNESLTHARHPLAVSVIGEYSEKELDELIKAGQVVFIEEFNVVMVLDDINAFRHYSPTKGSYYSSNRLLRVINTISNYCYYSYDINFVGVLDNDEDGRDVLKSDIIGYLNNMQANKGIKNFNGAQDVIVEANPDDPSAVDMYIAIQGVDAIEKIYIEITAQ